MPDTASPPAVVRHDPAHRGFGSDNQAGMHAEILAAIAAANGGHVAGYGADPYTAALAATVRRHFGAAARVYPVFSGTGANVVALAAATGRWQAVICTASAHIATDEGGAPEQLAGLKLMSVPAADGKLTAADVERVAAQAREVHQARLAVVSLTQATELGTLYTVAELRALADAAHAHGMAVHLDGARLANACAALGVPLRALTTDVGIDVVSLGGTKTGLLGGDAVVVLNEAAVPGAEYARKGLGQLGSKLRFISAQFEALYGGDLWLRLAGAANERARQLADALRGFDGLRVPYPVEANAVFVQVPPHTEAMLAERFGCHPFERPEHAVRIMCAWDTTADDVHTLVAALTESVGG